jgi:hypothetical protein
VVGFFIDPNKRGPNLGDGLAPDDGLKERFADVMAGTENPWIDRTNTERDFQDSSRYPRMEAALRILVENKLTDTRDPKDVVICVAGGGDVAAEAVALLRLGVTVVFRENRSKWEGFLEVNGDIPEIQAGLENKQLIFSDYKTEDHPKKYDIIIWPYPFIYRLGAPDNLSYEYLFAHITAGLKDGGIVIIQTDRERFYEALTEQEGLKVEALYKNDHASPLDYLLPSTWVQENTESYLGVFRLYPAERASKRTPGAGNLGDGEEMTKDEMLKEKWFGNDPVYQVLKGHDSVSGDLQILRGQLEVVKKLVLNIKQDAPPEPGRPSWRDRLYNFLRGKLALEDEADQVFEELLALDI